MSFEFSYREMVSVAIRAESGDAPLAGFAIEPTTEGLRRLREHRMISRSGAGTLFLYYPTNVGATSPQIAPITERTRFGFAVRSIAPADTRPYEPQLTGNSGAQLYFDNLAPDKSVLGSGSLMQEDVAGDADAVRIVAPVFRFALEGGATGSERRVSVVELGGEGEELLFDLPAGAVEAYIDLREGPRGPVEVGVEGAADPRLLYVDEELAAHPPLAVIELFWETSQDSVTPAGMPYTIRFKRHAS